MATYVAKQQTVGGGTTGGYSYSGSGGNTGAVTGGSSPTQSSTPSPQPVTPTGTLRGAGTKYSVDDLHEKYGLSIDEVQYLQGRGNPTWEPSRDLSAYAGSVPNQSAPSAPQVQGVNQVSQPQDYQSPTAPLGSAERTQQLLQLAKQQTGTQTAPTTGQNGPQGAQTGQPALTMPASGSVVDLLNMAGQDSSFAARQQLAQQYGVKGYTGTAAQNQELSKKFLEAYNAQKGAVPQSGAEARSALDSYFQGTDQQLGTPEQQFFDMLASQNPIEAMLFQQMSQLMNSQQNQQSFAELYAEEVAKQGIPSLQMELADIQRIMDGTEDDIRAEITATGGFATESQVQALTGARNKVLLRKADYLSNVLAAKNDYIDTVMSLTKADREEMSKQIDRKLGLTEMMFNMSQQMTRNAKENYNNIIANAGYDGLVNSMRTPEELANAARTLGMTPNMLLQMSTIKTPAQRSMELDELNYQLSVQKFDEDKRQFGMQYALEKQKLAAANAATTVLSPYQQERSARTLNSVGEIKGKVSSDTVGWGALSAILPSSKARDFAAQVDTLKANILQSELAAMREASKTGGAVGNMSDKEGALLQASLGALDTKQSPTSFTNQLNKIEENIWRWNNQMYSLANNIDYLSAKAYYTQELGSEYKAEQYMYQQFSGQ